MILMSILKAILASEQKVKDDKELALSEKKRMIDEANQKAKLETKATLEKAHQEALAIVQNKEAEIKRLDTAFNQDIETTKTSLLKDIDEKQDKAFDFLLGVIL